MATPHSDDHATHCWEDDGGTIPPEPLPSALTEEERAAMKAAGKGLSPDALEAVIARYTKGETWLERCQRLITQRPTAATETDSEQYRRQLTGG